MAAGIAGAAAPSSAMDALGASTPAQPGAGADQARAQVMAKMQQLRDLDQQVQDVMGDPNLQPIAQQMRQLIKKAVQMAAQGAPTQTGSAEALPTAGQ